MLDFISPNNNSCKIWRNIFKDNSLNIYYMSAHYNCLGCHKNLSVEKFDFNKKSNKPYSRCKKCRVIHNKEYNKKIIPFERSFASHEKSAFWHPTKNGDVKPRDVTRGTNKKYWFTCDKCPHNFESGVSGITGKCRWCPYCSINTSKLCNCDFCYKKSFASHPKAVFWHPTKNGNIKPRDVTKGASRKYWFTCGECPHDFDTEPYNITGPNAGWCPYCNKKLCDDDCDFCYKKSFANHPKAILWHPTKNGIIKPRDIIKGTAKKFWFKCGKCPHDFDTQPYNITEPNAGCIYCANKKLCDGNCNICYNKSFANHEKSAFWHPTKNGDVKPRDIIKGTDKKYWFSCDKCPHDFDTSPNNITNPSRNGCWCPYCANKKLCDGNCNICYNKIICKSRKISILASN